MNPVNITVHVFELNHLISAIGITKVPELSDRVSQVYASLPILRVAHTRQNQIARRGVLTLKTSTQKEKNERRLV